MMYQDRLAIAVKSNGKVLREQGDTVFIPFGSEYTLYIKNMHSLRALVRIEIDGTDATEGTSLIVAANSSLELERFIKAGNFSSGQRFKFIERTAKIENGPRGIKAEDGLIRIEFEFEQEPAKKIPPPVTYWPTYGGDIHHHHYHRVSDSLLRGSVSKGSSAGSPDVYGSMSNTFGASGASGSLSSTAGGGGTFSASAAMSDSSPTISSNAAFVNHVGDLGQQTYGSTRSVKTSTKISKQAAAADVNEKGITVGGSISEQRFVTGAWFPTDGVKHVMIIKVLGAVGEKRVEKAVTVNAKQECPTCGTTNKFGTKFCRECGTGLVQA